VDPLLQVIRGGGSTRKLSITKDVSCKLVAGLDVPASDAYVRRANVIRLTRENLEPFQRGISSCSFPLIPYLRIKRIDKG
jgi:hypothetical protein